MPLSPTAARRAQARRLAFRAAARAGLSAPVAPLSAGAPRAPSAAFQAALARPMGDAAILERGDAAMAAGRPGGRMRTAARWDADATHDAFGPTRAYAAGLETL